ncbi:hypothetical protein Emag_001682 [Eimeria magna]
MARWVAGDSAGLISFFDCSGGSRVVRPYIPHVDKNSSCSDSSKDNNDNSSSSDRSYYQKLLQSHCSCLTFSGGWGGYDESEVTLGTSEGGIFAVSSQWPDVTAASAAAAGSSSSSSSYVGFPRTEGEAEVLRCASLPYCVLLVQMLGAHTPELERLMRYSEAAARGPAAAEAAYPGLDQTLCCRMLCNSSSISSSCHSRRDNLFGSDRQLLAVDKGGNGVVLDWCSSGSSSSSNHGLCEAAELREFSLREPLCCCSSNSLLQQQLAVASATAASFLSVYDIEASAFSFYAHVPPAAAAAQTIICCSSSSSRSMTREGAAAAEGRGSTSSSSTRAPVYAEVASPWPCRDTEAAAAAEGSTSKVSSKQQQQVCTSVSWVPRLGPTVLCGVTADALLLLYDTRASAFPVYITSTVAAGTPRGAPREASRKKWTPRPMIFVGSQPGMVAAHDQMEAAVIPCCCPCCCCTVCKHQQQQHRQQPQQHQQGQVAEHQLQESLFEGHRGRLVLKPHATSRRKCGSGSSDSSSSASGANINSSRSSSVPILSSKLQQRIREEFAGIIEAHRHQAAHAKVQSDGSSKHAPRASPTPTVASAKVGVAEALGCKSSNSSRGSGSPSSKGEKPMREQQNWATALVMLSGSSDSPLTSFPAASRTSERQQQQRWQQQQHGTKLSPEVKGWLGTACFELVAASLSVLLSEKHTVRRYLLRHTQQQLLLLLRSSCLPAEALNPSAVAAVGTAPASSKSRSNSSNGSCSEKSSAAAAAATMARPSKKARVKAAAAAAPCAESAGEAAAAFSEKPGSAGTATGAAAQAAAGAHHEVLQEFAGRVVRLLRLLGPAEDGSGGEGVKEEHLLHQQVQALLPVLLQRQQQNVLRLLDYCAAFSFCFSQAFLCSSTKGPSLQSCPQTEGLPSRDPRAAAKAAEPDMQQAELPGLLLQRATKKVLRQFKKYVSSRETVFPDIADAAAVAAVAAAAGSFVGQLQVGFGLGAQRPHLLFSVLLCWLQHQRDFTVQHVREASSGEADRSSSAEREEQQHSEKEEHAIEIPELHIQRNCICRLPISDALYFSVANQQNSRKKRSNNLRSNSVNSSSINSSSSGKDRVYGVSCSGSLLDSARLICCNTAGDISVLRVTVQRFKSQREKQLYVQRKAAFPAAGGNATESGVLPQEQAHDPLASSQIWFPQLPTLYTGTHTPEPSRLAEQEAPTNSKAKEKACGCCCCTSSYSVELEMCFRAPRSSASSSNLSVHSNGSYLLLASKDPYFALYCIDPDLPPYQGPNRSRVAPLLGLALPPSTAAQLQQQQQAAADVVQPLLLSAAPLLPCVPLPTCLPPYLAAPPIPPAQVSLQLRFQQHVQEQQQQAAPAAANNLGVAAWDTAVEFSDWLSEPEEPEWSQSEEE